MALKLIKGIITFDELDPNQIFSIEAHWTSGSETGIFSYEHITNGEGINPQFVYLWLDLIESIYDNSDDYMMVFVDGEYHIYLKAHLVITPTKEVLDLLNDRLKISVVLQK